MIYRRRILARADLQEALKRGDGCRVLSPEPMKHPQAIVNFREAGI
jgi:hypothetical protein